MASSAGTPQPNPQLDKSGCCEVDYDVLPDACTNDIREEDLIRRQQKDDRTWGQQFVERERNLLIACFVIAVAMNVSTGRYLLYPFQIFSTWVHELCHGLAAILTGGGISKLEIFQDGSGLAHTWSTLNWKRGFIASAGYPGTAVTGCLLLLFRRTTLGPTLGTIGFGICIVISCALWVRNMWGLCVLFSEGLLLILIGWKMSATTVDNLYNFLAATCCLNAVESIRDLFAEGDYYVGGQVVTTSDAHTVAEYWGLDYRVWAYQWLTMSIGLTIVGIVFALDAKTTTWFKSGNSNAGYLVSRESGTHKEVVTARNPVRSRVVGPAEPDSLFRALPTIAESNQKFGWFASKPPPMAKATVY